MPRKRVKRKKSTRTSTVKRGVKTLRKKSSKPISIVPTRNKFRIIIKNLILFGVLFFLSVILYNFSGTDEILLNFFWFLALITGFVTVAFVITFFVFLFLKFLRK